MALSGFISDVLGPSTSTWVTPAIEGAATGALGSALTGGNPLKGGLVGGLTGAGIGAFGGENGALAQALGLTGPQVNALIGAAGGGLGYGLTGQSPLIGALLGGAGGYMYNGKPGALRDDSGSFYETGGDLKEGGPGNGWTDAATGQPVDPNTMVQQGQGGGGLGAVAAKLLGGDGAGAGGMSKTSAILGTLAALGSALSRPKQGTWATPGPASNAANLGPTFSATLNPNVSGRTAINPFAGGTPAYWAYGGPERVYFGGNSLKSYGFAEGGALSAAMRPDDGGEEDGEFSTANGEHYVQGPGDGQSDDIPARLASGEYVLTAMDVARIGQGSNEAGARKLDDFRKKLAKSSGQKQFIPRGQDRHLGGLIGDRR